MKTSLLLRLSPLVLAAALAGGAAFAQSAPPPPGEHKHAMAERMHDMMEEHARDLRIALGVRPDQDAAWQAFIGAMHPDMDGDKHEEHRDHAAMGSMTTPQALDMMEARMGEHMAALHRRNEAIKRFYAVLSPEQQKVFDALARLHHHEMGRMHGGMLMGPGMMGHNEGDEE